MKQKLKILLSILGSFILFLNISSTSASLGVKSIFFNNNQTAQLLGNNQINSYPLKTNNSYNNFGYRVFTALSMLGIKTYERNSSDILLDFRSRFGSNETGDEISTNELLFIDELVASREQLNQHIINYHRGNYSSLKINVSNQDTLSNNYIAQVYLTLNYLPGNLTESLNSVSIHYSDQGYNGYGGNGTIKIRGGYLIDNTKFRNVLLHELGHVLDTGMIGNVDSGLSRFRDNQTPIYNDDPNLKFFKLAWANESNWKSGIQLSDFVSTYATTNPYEDFAESYALYVSNGYQFRCLAERSVVIESKYNYFRENIFLGREYFTGSESCDSTKLISDVTDL